MCLLILTDVEQRFKVETGIDMTAQTYKDFRDTDFFDINCRKGKMFPMGPKCTVNVPKVPCTITWSKKTSLPQIS